MLAQFYAMMSAGVGYVLIAGFVALVALLLIVQRRARRVRHDYDQLVATHHNVRDAYHELRSRTGGDGLTADDRALLEELAEELVGCLVSHDEEPLLTGAEGVTIATLPAPIIEIEYPDRLVTLSLAVEHYEGAEEVLA